MLRCILERRLTLINEGLYSPTVKVRDFSLNTDLLQILVHLQECYISSKMVKSNLGYSLGKTPRLYGYSRWS
jgi:hypothetical protein